MKSDLPWEEQTSQMGCDLGSLTQPKQMKLSKFIELFYKSRNAKLAASLEKPVRYDQVSKWVDRNGICIDGVIYCEVARIKGVK